MLADDPAQWPAWNMDWEQEQAAPKNYVSGPAQIRVVENGPSRVVIEVSRETAGSRFVQTISLAAGDSGKRVEFANVIDWNTRESNLKATFPLAASNQMATYNWDIGTVERPTAEQKKFEVPSHQWVDLTDMSGKFGVTILTDCKNGSDKPNDHTIRLTLIRTPGTAGGYQDEATQDIGHHEFVYGIAGHAAGWRDAQTDWQAQRLNAPLIAFQATKHVGQLGRSFSLLKVSNPRIRILALKKAEHSDEVIVRMVELDGKPQSGVRLSLAAPLKSAREVNGQEQPVGPATLIGGVLETSFGAYQPRTFAVRLGLSTTKVEGVRSTPVMLSYDTAAATNDGDRSVGGFDGKGDALPAEMLPAQIAFNGVQFQLAQAKTGAPNAVVAKGQTLNLPSGPYNRIYVLAASAEGDQKATFEAGSRKVELNIQDWGGYIGQWDNRLWSSADVSHDNYGEITGLKPGFIKRADLVWYCSHHHNAAGENVPYSYSYLFGYEIDLPNGAKTLRLPNNNKIRILAISLAGENPDVKPVQRIYDELPSAKAGPADFMLSVLPVNTPIPQGRTATRTIIVMPRGNLNSDVKLTTSGLPAGVTATFNPASTAGTSTMTLTAPNSAIPATTDFTITGVSGNSFHSVTSAITIAAVATGTVPVDLSSAYNVTGIYNDGVTFARNASLDRSGYALSAEALGAGQVGGGVDFNLGPPNAPDAVTGGSVSLPKGRFASLKVLASGVEGDQELRTFAINYVDATSTSFTQSLSDWARRGHLDGESVAVNLHYRVRFDGSMDRRPFYLCAYSFALDDKKVVRSIVLPGNRNVLVFAMTLVPPQR